MTSSSAASNGNASNDLIASLPSRERNRILKRCENVTLAQDEVLMQPGERIRHVYFPLDCFISLLTSVDSHEALAVDLIGSEGMLGASLVLGVSSSLLRARVQGAGRALRMTALDFQRALEEAPMLERHLRLYLSVEMMQLAQTAGCAAFHVVEARLACWLLMSHDRAHSNRFYLTHDRLARMLGVRRSGVTTAAGTLQSHKLIRYTRGHIAVLDRKGLEQAACGCYRVVRDAFKLVATQAREQDEPEDEVQPGVDPQRAPLAPEESEHPRASRSSSSQATAPNTDERPPTRARHEDSGKHQVRH